MDGVCLEQQANIRIKTSQKVTLSPTLGNETAVFLNSQHSFQLLTTKYIDIVDESSCMKCLATSVQPLFYVSIFKCDIQ